MSLLTLGRHIRALTDQMTAAQQAIEPPAPRSYPRGYETGEDFLAWLEEVSPSWNWRFRHLKLLQTKLAAVTRGEVKKLMVFMPPRHGKSQCTTVRYPVYRLERDPTTRVIIAAYNQTLAEKFSRDARRIAELRVTLSPDRTAVHDWETAKGGGIRAVGVGGGVTGHGGHLIVIDDPVASREDAESQTERDRVWQWYLDDLQTRREPGAAMILQLTRWHSDDLAGRILASPDGPNWHVVTLPAFAEDDDPLGRGKVMCPRCEGAGSMPAAPGITCMVCEGEGTVGEALCPERYPLESLAEQKIAQGRGFYALYQQRPSARDGAMFKWDWFRKVAARPAHVRTRLRYWDTAGTEGRGDYTAGVLMSITPEGVFTIEDVVRGRWSPARKDQEIRAAAERDITLQGSYRVWLEQEAGIGGAERTGATIRALRGFSVRAEKVSGSKEVRAEPLAAQAEVGNVQILVGEWNRDFLEEMCAFPFGRHDDQVDAAAGALNKLATRSFEGPLPSGFMDRARGVSRGFV